MEDLPPVLDIYNSIQENHDYGVTRRYQTLGIPAFNKKAPTKKGHYIQDVIKMNISPGPATEANKQLTWGVKSLNVKYPTRLTYVDEIQQNAKKRISPSPSSYNRDMPWPKKDTTSKKASDKTTFADHCLYESTLSPGVGAYNVKSYMGCKKQSGKFSTTKSIQQKEQPVPNMNTYSPCAIDYHTFQSSLMHPSKSPGLKSPVKKQSKENQVPGPGHYPLINHWRGKQAQKENQKDYMRLITKGRTPGVYP